MSIEENLWENSSKNVAKPLPLLEKRYALVGIVIIPKDHRLKRMSNGFGVKLRTLKKQSPDLNEKESGQNNGLETSMPGSGLRETMERPWRFRSTTP